MQRNIVCKSRSGKHNVTGLFRRGSGSWDLVALREHGALFRRARFSTSTPPPSGGNDGGEPDETDAALAAVLEDVKQRVHSLQKMGIDLAGLEGVKMPGEKMVLQFTCDYHGPKANSENGCNHQNTKLISKNSYETGVVLVRCDRCSNLHLIADNKGFFDDDAINIETIMREKGQEVKRMLAADEVDIA
jgi:hypothetical protein